MTGAATVLAVLVAGVVVSTRFAIRAERARIEAEAASRFLRSDLLPSMDPFETTNPFVTSGQKITVRSFLDMASDKLKGQFAAWFRNGRFRVTVDGECV